MYSKLDKTKKQSVANASLKKPQHNISATSIIDNRPKSESQKILNKTAQFKKNISANVIQKAKIDIKKLSLEIAQIYELLPENFKIIIQLIPQDQFEPFYELSPKQQINFFHILQTTGQMAVSMLMAMPSQKSITLGDQNQKTSPNENFHIFLSQNQNIIQQIFNMTTGKMGQFHFGSKTLFIDAPSLLKMSASNMLTGFEKRQPMLEGPQVEPVLKLMPPLLGGIETDVAIVQQVIRELQITASTQNLDSSDFIKLTNAIRLCIEKIPEKKKQQKVDQLREMIDNLPNEYSEMVVNIAHKALNPYDHQLSVPGAKFLGPSKVKHSTLVKTFEGDQKARSISSKDDHSHISNRGIQQVVRIEGQLYTPIYMTVFKDASGQKGRPEYKDVEQNQNGQIMIHTGGKGPGENTLWISIGRPLRQIKWSELYGSKKGTPLIRSFLIPLEAANIISQRTATEHKTSGYDVDFNVDKHYEMNQTGINRGASLEMLRRYALPGSLRTYSDPGVFKKQPPPKHWGDTRSMHEINEKMGIPNEPLANFDVFVNKSQSDFTPQKEYAGQAEQLSRIYAYYTGNEALLPVNEKIPPDAKKLAQDFYLANRPNDKISINDFMEKYVSLWASQAQISKVIADDYEDVVKKEDQLKEHAPEITFTTKTRKGHRGERRSASAAMSKQIQTLLQSRYDFLAALNSADKTITGIFKDKQYKGNSKKYLGPVRKWIRDLQKDYGFTAGDIEIVKKAFPKYREQANEHVKTLEANCLQDPNVLPVINALKQALFVKISTSTSSTGFSIPVSMGSLTPPNSVPQVQVDVVESGQSLHANTTAGGGDCFYHSIYETLNNAKSNTGTQQTIRDQIVLAIQTNRRLAQSHFGTGVSGQTAAQRFINEVSTQSTWVPDHGPAIIADALGIRIIVHRPNGAIYYDAQPNTTISGGVRATIHLQYTGSHYNSYTVNLL